MRRAAGITLEERFFTAFCLIDKASPSVAESPHSDLSSAESSRDTNRSCCQFVTVSLHAVFRVELETSSLTL